MVDSTKAAEWYRRLRFLAERARWDEHNGRLVVELTDDEHYGYADMVRDIEALFGLTAVRNAVRLWKLTGDSEGAMAVIEQALRQTQQVEGRDAN